MAELTVRKILKEGLIQGAALPYETASVADTFPNDGLTFLHYKNGHVTEVPIVTVDSVQKCNQGVDDNIAAPQMPITTGELMIGPFDRGRFNNAAGHVSVTVDAVTTLTVAAFSLKPA